MARARFEPFAVVATGIFVLAILHTFAAARFTAWSHRVQRRHDDAARARGRAPVPSVAAEVLHFFGEVEVVFGLWAVVLVAAVDAAGWDGQPTHYLNDTVNYTEPLFVVVIMALASTRPIVALGRSRAAAGGRARRRRRPAAWWMAILIDRAAARLAHHRAGGDDDLRAAARRASSTISAERRG